MRARAGPGTRAYVRALAPMRTRTRTRARARTHAHAHAHARARARARTRTRTRSSGGRFPSRKCHMNKISGPPSNGRGQRGPDRRSVNTALASDVASAGRKGTMDVHVLQIHVFETDWCEGCGSQGGEPTRLSFPDGSMRALWCCAACVRDGSKLALALDLQRGDWRVRADAWARDASRW